MGLLAAEPAAARLVTLCGSGGCGKTRLALEAARRVVGGGVARFDEVWLVELGSLIDPAQVTAALAASLGAHEAPEDEEPASSLARRLRGRRSLLLLDNCEHVLRACTALVHHLLRACPELLVLATSREPLGIAGELTWELAPLPVPPGDGDLALDTLGAYDAVQLFLDRARLRLPGFALTADNAAEVTRICRRLDGLPLAIELAAGRLRALSLTQVADRLGDRFRLLVGGSAVTPRRQRTLWTAVEWSYGLLSPEEQQTFRRLAVFAGGWTLEAAEAVCPPPAASGTEDVLDRMGQLVEKSLVVRQERPDEAGGVHYALLETLREFGARRLREAGEEAAVRGAHLEWCLRLAEAAAKDFRGSREAEALDRLERERDNLRAALEWGATGPDRLDAGLRLAAALSWFWFIRGPRSEGRAALAALLAVDDAAPATRWTALAGLGLLSVAVGDYGAGRAQLREALGLARALGEERGVAEALALHTHLAFALGTHRNPEEQAWLAEECLALGQDLWDDHIAAEALAWQALLARDRRDHDAARTTGKRSLLLSRGQADQWGVARTLRLLAEVARLTSDDKQAVVLTDERLAIARALRDDEAVAHSLQVLGELALRRGEPAAAASLLDESVAQRRALGDGRQLADGLRHRGWIALHCGDLAGATALFRQSLEYAAHAAPRGQTLRVAQCLVGLAETARMEGDEGRAATLLGACEGMRGELELLYPPTYERLLLVDQVSAARTSLHRPGESRAWETGLALDWRDAGRVARGDHPAETGSLPLR